MRGHTAHITMHRPWDDAGQLPYELEFTNLSNVPPVKPLWRLRIGDNNANVILFFDSLEEWREFQSAINNLQES